MSKANDFYAGDKNYQQIWEWFLARHRPNFDRNFTEYDLWKIHQRWQKLGKES